MGFILTEANIDIERKIRDAGYRKIIKNFDNPVNLRVIADVVKLFVREAIVSSNTWQSISFASDPEYSLQAHFGIPKGQVEGNLNKILETWLQEVKVVPRKISSFGLSKFKLIYDFYAIQGDWGNVLNLREGVTINNETSNPQFKGLELPWLSWLLVAGDQLVIKDAKIIFGNKPNSRSGEAIMANIKDESWIIPRQFQPFNTDNNFVTIALAELAKNEQFRSQMTERFIEICQLDSTSSAPFSLLNSL